MKIAMVRVAAGGGRCRHVVAVRAAVPGVGYEDERAARDAGGLWDTNPSTSLRVLRRLAPAQQCHPPREPDERQIQQPYHHKPELAEVYFTLSAHLELDWLRARIEELPVDDRWKNLGRLALSDDLFSLQAAWAADAAAQGVNACLAANRVEVDRYLQVGHDIKSSNWFDLINISVAIRVTGNLTRSKAAT